MSFIARYPGWCCQCGERIKLGDKCRYWGDEDEEIGHVTCPEDPDLAPISEKCPDCNMEHKGECL